MAELSRVSAAVSRTLAYRIAEVLAVVLVGSVLCITLVAAVLMALGLL